MFFKHQYPGCLQGAHAVTGMFISVVAIQTPILIYICCFSASLPTEANYCLVISWGQGEGVWKIQIVQYTRTAWNSQIFLCRYITEFG